LSSILYVQGYELSEMPPTLPTCGKFITQMEELEE